MVRYEYCSMHLSCHVNALPISINVNVIEWNQTYIHVGLELTYCNFWMGQMQACMGTHGEKMLIIVTTHYTCSCGTLYGVVKQINYNVMIWSWYVNRGISNHSTFWFMYLTLTLSAVWPVYSYHKLVILVIAPIGARVSHCAYIFSFAMQYNYSSFCLFHVLYHVWSVDF